MTAKTKKNKSGASFGQLAILALLLIGLSLGAWYLLAPQSLARSLGQIFPKPLEIQGLDFRLESKPVLLSPGETIKIHPTQQFTIEALNSSRWLNYDLHLVADDFNIHKVTNGNFATPLELNQNVSKEAQSWVLEIKDGSADSSEVVATFIISSRYTALDFAAKADKAHDLVEKAELYAQAALLEPDNQAVKDKLVQAWLAAKKPEKAAELLEGEIAKQGSKINLWQQLLAIYQQTGDSNKQITALKALIDLGDAAAIWEYRWQLAEIYKTLKRWPEAAQIYEEALADVPNNQKAAILSQLIIIYRETEEINKEVGALKQLLDVVPPEQSVAIWGEIAKIYDRSGTFDERLKAWQMLAKLLTEKSDKTNAYLMIANLLVEAKRYTEAQKAYEEALNLTPQNRVARLNLARSFAASGNQPAYRAQLALLVENSPTEMSYRQELAQALLEDKQIKQAKKVYQEIVNMMPNDKASRLILIDLMEKTNDKKGLIEQYNKMMADYPQDAVLAYNLGVMHYEQKRLPQAIEAFKKATAINPKDADAHGYLLLAYQQQGSKARPEMLQEALELFRLDPSKEVYRTLMLNTYENAKDWQNYLKAAEAFAKLAPNNPESFRLLARAQNTLNLKSEAAQSLWQMATASGSETKPWFEAAKAFAGLGQNEKAIEAYQKILEIEPNNAQALKARKELEEKS